MTEKKDTAFLQADNINKTAEITNTVISVYHSIICGDGTVAGRIAGRIIQSVAAAAGIFEGSMEISEIQSKYPTKKNSTDEILN